MANPRLIQVLATCLCLWATAQVARRLNQDESSKSSMEHLRAARRLFHDASSPSVHSRARMNLLEDDQAVVRQTYWLYDINLNYQREVQFQFISVGPVCGDDWFMNYTVFGIFKNITELMISRNSIAANVRSYKFACDNVSSSVDVDVRLGYWNGTSATAIANDVQALVENAGSLFGDLTAFQINGVVGVEIDKVPPIDLATERDIMFGYEFVGSVCVEWFSGSQRFESFDNLTTQTISTNSIAKLVWNYRYNCDNVTSYIFADARLTYANGTSGADMKADVISLVDKADNVFNAGEMYAKYNITGVAAIAKGVVPTIDRRIQRDVQFEFFGPDCSVFLTRNSTIADNFNRTITAKIGRASTATFVWIYMFTCGSIVADVRLTFAAGSSAAAMDAGVQTLVENAATVFGDLSEFGVTDLKLQQAVNGQVNSSSSQSGNEEYMIASRDQQAVVRQTYWLYDINLNYQREVQFQFTSVGPVCGDDWFMNYTVFGIFKNITELMISRNSIAANVRSYKFACDNVSSSVDVDVRLGYWNGTSATAIANDVQALVENAGSLFGDLTAFQINGVVGVEIDKVPPIDLATERDIMFGYEFVGSVCVEWFSGSQRFESFDNLTTQTISTNSIAKLVWNYRYNCDNVTSYIFADARLTYANGTSGADMKADVISLVDKADNVFNAGEMYAKYNITGVTAIVKGVVPTIDRTVQRDVQFEFFGPDCSVFLAENRTVADNFNRTITAKIGGASTATSVWIYMFTCGSIVADVRLTFAAGTPAAAMDAGVQTLVENVVLIFGDLSAFGVTSIEAQAVEEGDVNSNDKDDLTLAIGLGIGLGVGIPLIIVW
eukprot:gene10988-4947_t